MQRLRADHGLYPISHDEAATCKAMLEQDETSHMLLLPTHHISAQGDMMGFRYECGANRPGEALPVLRTMFFGHTATECQDDDAAIMRLLSDPEGIRRKMEEFIQELRDAYQPADLSCIPDNATVVTSTGLMQATDLRSVDCKPWAPELPESIGLYHAYIRGYNRDIRTHKLFIACSGGCAKAADQFCNLIIDVGREWTACEIVDSEEAWWLRRACQRARCRLIKMLADKFGVRVPSVEDVLAFAGAKDRAILQAVPTTDTVEHDLARLGPSTVALHNLAVDTTRITNGILCQMHPAEGYWLFRGAPRGTGVHGAMFGSHAVCGAFPTRSPRLPGAAKHPNSVAVQDGAHVMRFGQGGRGERRHYLCFDEAFFKNLERMQWNRDNGFVELELKDTKINKTQKKVLELTKILEDTQRSTGLLSENSQVAQKALDSSLTDLQNAKNEELSDYDDTWYPTLWRAYRAFGPS